MSLRLYHSEDGSLLDGRDLSGMGEWEILQFARELETEANLLAENDESPSLGDEDVACGLQDLSAMAVIAIRAKSLAHHGNAAEQMTDHRMQDLLYRGAAT